MILPTASWLFVVHRIELCRRFVVLVSAHCYSTTATFFLYAFCISVHQSLVVLIM